MSTTLPRPVIPASDPADTERGIRAAKRLIAQYHAADPNYQLLAIGADAPLTYFRWLFARKIEAERNAAKAA